MCGIFAIFGSPKSDDALRKVAIKCAKKLRHRGPDWSGCYCKDGVAIVHERLAIVDPESGAQPMYSNDRTIVLGVNGEIWNHRAIRAETKGALGAHKYATQSDCEVIIPLYQEYGSDHVGHLDGMFAYVIYNEAKKEYVIARDHLGKCPLYFGHANDGSMVVASEMKALFEYCSTFELFPPGQVFSGSLPARASDGFKHWYSPTWYDESAVPTGKLDYAELRTGFMNAVHKRMMSDVPWGVLLSGGLDSSLVASIASRYAKVRTEDGDQGAAWWPQIHSFSIGLEGSPDLAAAKVVADSIGTIHHGYTFTPQEGYDALRDVIYHLETFDVTTIRAGTPMFLMSRKIRAMGVKMVLSGEGADEAFGGYLYFHKCPNKEEFHRETVRKLKDLHKFDCLRANKSTSAFGLEARTPFLDRQFLDLVMGLDPVHKMCVVRDEDRKRGSVEKFIVRKAFDTPESPFLPEAVLWRQKEQFSDGVGYGWIDGLRALANREVSDDQFAKAKFRFPVNTPATKEAYHYRAIFEDVFNSHPSAIASVPAGPSVACSTAKAIEWDEAFKKMAAEQNGECSGRAVAGVHVSAYADGANAAESESPAKRARR